MNMNKPRGCIKLGELSEHLMLDTQTQSGAKIISTDAANHYRLSSQRMTMSNNDGNLKPPFRNNVACKTIFDKYVHGYGLFNFVASPSIFHPLFWHLELLITL